MVKKDDNIHYKKVEIVILYVLRSKLIQSNKSMVILRKVFRDSLDSYP